MSWEHIHNPKTVEQRFWAKVDKSGDCWIWLGVNRKGGYGGFQDGERYVYAHRFSWQLHFGDIPKGMCVLHKCDNPGCVNPAHLFLGTVQDNNEDKKQKGRQAKKLQENDIPIIRQLSDFGFTRTYLAKVFGVCQQEISNIVTGKKWKHIPKEQP